MSTFYEFINNNYEMFGVFCQYTKLLTDLQMDIPLSRGISGLFPQRLIAMSRNAVCFHNRLQEMLRPALDTDDLSLDQHLSESILHHRVCLVFGTQFYVALF